MQQLLEKGSKERDTNPRRAIETYQEALAYILKEVRLLQTIPEQTIVCLVLMDCIVDQ